MIVLTKEMIADLVPVRDKNSYKSKFGSVLMIGGNAQFGGAIIMSSQAAVHSGAGLTTVATDASNHAALHARLPEAMVLDFKDKDGVKQQIEKSNVIAIGPGLGLTDYAVTLVKLAIETVTKEQTLVLDGDALTILAQEKFNLTHTNAVLTPHPGEWKRLSGLSVEEQTETENKKWQEKYGATVVLKGGQTEIYTDQSVYQNISGHPAMATGGMGDTLTGSIAGMVAQLEFDGVLVGTYVHSLIGKTLAKERYVVLPSHIAEALPYYLNRLAHESKSYKHK